MDLAFKVMIADMHRDQSQKKKAQREEEARLLKFEWEGLAQNLSDTLQNDIDQRIQAIQDRVDKEASEVVQYKHS